MNFTSSEIIAGQMESTGRLKDDVLLFVQIFCRKNENGPLIREICLAIDTLHHKDTTTSSSHINDILNSLEQEGFIARDVYKDRHVPGRIRYIGEHTTN